MLVLKHVEAFVTVADLGSFRRAVDRLHTTQPNISNRIAQLEARLGQVLMERDAGSVRLTPQGRRLLGPARAVLAAADAMLAATGEDAVLDGTLRLGVAELVAHTWLRPFLRQMKDRFPQVVVELTVDLSATLSEALFARDLDLVFLNGPFDRPARGTAPLGQAPLVWVAAEAPEGPLTPARLAALPILTHARGTAPYRQLSDHFRALGLQPRLVPAANTGACLQMALDGLGLACLPAALVDRQIAGGQLVALDYDWRPPPLRFAARHDLDPAPALIGRAIQIAQSLSPPDDQQS